MDRVANPAAVTPAQRAGLELCEEHSRRVAAAMGATERAAELALLLAPPPKPVVNIESTILRLCSRKKGATYEAIVVACALIHRLAVHECFIRLIDEKKIVPCGGRSRGSFKTVDTRTTAAGAPR